MTDGFDWKKYVTECLQSTEYCSIATAGVDGVWANPVFFAWDDNFNLYFISQMHSKHMQNLSQDKQIAVAVYKTEQKGDVAGVQIKGKANILTGDPGAIKNAFDIYYGRAGKGEDVEGYINNPTWIFVKITPEKVSYFDTRHFGEERQEVPLDNLVK